MTGVSLTSHKAQFLLSLETCQVAVLIGAVILRVLPVHRSLGLKVIAVVPEEKVTSVTMKL